MNCYVLCPDNKQMPFKIHSTLDFYFVSVIVGLKLAACVEL